MLVATRYDMRGIETSLAVHNMASDPSDLTFLISHLRELPEEALRYMTWAAFFGETQVYSLGITI
jgi:hypothetical protein